MEREILAYHVCTYGGEEQQDAENAYHLYDMISHNEISTNDAILKCIEESGDELNADKEIIPDCCIIYGKSDDGKYILTYDEFTGDFDVWEVE